MVVGNSDTCRVWNSRLILEVMDKDGTHLIILSSKAQLSCRMMWYCAFSFSDEFPLAHLLQPFRQYYLQAEHSLPALIQIRLEGPLRDACVWFFQVSFGSIWSFQVSGMPQTSCLVLVHPWKVYRYPYFNRWRNTLRLWPALWHSSRLCCWLRACLFLVLFCC